MLLVFLALVSLCHADLTEEQRQVPLEVDAPDAALAKIVLLAGSVSNKPGQHEYFAGCALMMEWLKQTPGVWPVLAAEGWPRNEAVLENAKAIVVYADGGSKLPFLEASRWEKMRNAIGSGAGLVMLHQAVDVPEDRAAEIQEWLGAVWKKDIGSRGHWDMEFASFVSHPVTRGLTPFAAPLDGWLFNLHFAPGARPVLAGKVPDSARSTSDAKSHSGRDEVVAWTYERPSGGRSFGFTGCDLHRNWQVESQRRFVINGILWSAGLEIPATGAAVDLRAGVLAENLDAKPVKAAKPARPAPTVVPGS